MGPMLTQDFAIAKHNLYFQNLGIYGFCKMSANLSYDQVLTLQWPYKCQWSWLAALYKGKGSVNKLHLLATSLTSSKIPIQHSHTEQQVTLILSCWLTALQHTTYFQHTVYYSIPHTSTSLLMATVLLYNTEWHLWKVLCGVFSSYTTQTYQIETAVNFLSSWTCPHAL